MYRHIGAVLGLFFLFASESRAQVHQEWVHTYDAAPSGNDRINSVAVAPSGSIYAAGVTGAQAALTLKYDPSGRLLWARTFTFSTHIDSAYRIVIDPSDESVYALGRCDPPSRPTAGLVLKYDHIGNLLWSKTCYGPFSSAEIDIARLGPGNHLFVGGDSAEGTFAAEYDPEGHLRWSSAAPGGLYVTDIAIDGFGNVLLSGTYDAVDVLSQFGVVKFSPNGALAWKTEVSGGGVGHGDAIQLATDSSGAIYAAGRLFDATGAPEEALVKLDPSGNVLWQRSHHGTQPMPDYYDEGLYAIALAANGNIRVAGRCANLGTETDMQVFEYTPAGHLVWQNSWDGPGSGDDEVTALITEADGSLTVLAETEQVSGEYDPVVIRYDAQGAFRWASVDLLSASGLNGYPYCGAVGPLAVRVFAGEAQSGSGSSTNAFVVAERDEVSAFCFGYGRSAPCPCGNQAVVGAGQGCANSLGDAARLASDGEPSLASDTLVLTSAGEVANTASVFLQGSAQMAPVPFGDGLLCIGLNLKRLYVHAAVGNVVFAPQASDLSIPARSAALGDPIAVDSLRFYQVYYRDGLTSFCPPPLGSSWNVSSGLAVLWVE
jgi:hypothetical protein